MQKFKDASTIAERMQLLFEQWVEHRILYSRFTALVSYWLTGQVNFVTIIMIGNFTLIALTILFWKMIKKTGASLYYLFPVVVTLFALGAYEGNLWAGASTVYMPVAFLGLASVYLLAYNNKTSFVVGMFLAILGALQIVAMLRWIRHRVQCAF